MLPDQLFPDGRAASDVDDQARHQVAQIEAAIESVGETCQVVGGVLAVLERVLNAGQRGLEVAQHGVHPEELRQVSRLAVTVLRRGLPTRHGAFLKQFAGEITAFFDGVTAYPIRFGDARSDR